MKVRYRRSLVAAMLVAATVAVAGASARSTTGSYVVHNLVSDQSGMADHTDPNLVNAWGLDALPTSPWWISDNGTSLSTLYTADGTRQPLVVSVPNDPTGLVANTGSKFVIGNGNNSGPALFMFATEEGKILGWNPSVTGTGSRVARDLSRSGAVLKGLAIAPGVDNGRLYTTDFHNRAVDVFTGSFKSVFIPGGFQDPSLPHRYAPFGIQVIGDHIFVTYAKQDAEKHDEIDGLGLGYVDEYTLDGTLVTRVASKGPLNAPWGIAWAPADFGTFGNDLLIGNFGDGWIHAYRQQQDGSFTLDGTLTSPNGYPIAIYGLWALEFGKGASANGPTNTLFFTAGPDSESHGLFGTITAQPPQ
jgi:uncharacterized protein (TIGR03118 family)